MISSGPPHLMHFTNLSFGLWILLHFMQTKDLAKTIINILLSGIKSLVSLDRLKFLVFFIVNKVMNSCKLSMKG